MPPQKLNFPPGTILALSVIHMFMGLLSLLTGIFISSEGVLKPERTGALELWTGPFFIYTGGMGFVAACVRRRTDVINHLAFSSISCLCSGLLVLGGSLLAEPSVVNGKEVGYSEPHLPLIAFGLIELITSVMSIIVCLHVMRTSDTETKMQIVCKATGMKKTQQPESNTVPTSEEPNEPASPGDVDGGYPAKSDYEASKAEASDLSVSRESERRQDTKRSIKDKRTFAVTGDQPTQGQDAPPTRDQALAGIPPKTCTIIEQPVCTSAKSRTVQGQARLVQNVPTTRVQAETSTKICISTGKPVGLSEKPGTGQGQDSQGQNVPTTRGQAATPTKICKSTGRPVDIPEKPRTVQGQAKTEPCRDSVVCPFSEFVQANGILNNTGNNTRSDSSSATQRESSSVTLKLEHTKESIPASVTSRPDTPEPGMKTPEKNYLTPEPEDNSSTNFDST